jgi:hypothetical protein
LRLKFWLPLPLLLIAFGLGGEPLTNQLLSCSYGTVDKLQADQPMEMQLAVNALVIEAEIEQEQEFTQVEIKTANSVLKKLEFEFPITELSMVEAMITQKLGLSSKVEKLQAGTKIKVQLSANLQGIIAEIEKEQGFTKVEVKTASSVLKNLEFKLPSTELSMIKAMIAQELGLSPENVRMLVSYRIKN